jgi:hypothetical protein
MRDVPQHEIIECLNRIASGESDVEQFDPDLRAWLVQLGLVNCTPLRTIELTDRGREKLEQEKHP